MSRALRSHPLLGADLAGSVPMVSFVTNKEYLGNTVDAPWHIFPFSPRAARSAAFLSEFHRQVAARINRPCLAWASRNGK
jgi:hypothetical protein